jgi:hypothetical protein
MTCPSIETLLPSSLMESDWPVVPSGMVRGTAEAVKRMARPVKTEERRTMIGMEDTE